MLGALPRVNATWRPRIAARKQKKCSPASWVKFLLGVCLSFARAFGPSSFTLPLIVTTKETGRQD